MPAYMCKVSHFVLTIPNYEKSLTWIGEGVVTGPAGAVVVLDEDVLVLEVVVIKPDVVLPADVGMPVAVIVVEVEEPPSPMQT